MADIYADEFKINESEEGTSDPNLESNASMRNTVHGAGGFFDQRNQNLKA